MIVVILKELIMSCEIKWSEKRN